MAGPVAVNLQVWKKDPKTYIVSGGAKGKVELVCSRCAETYTTEVKSDLDLEFRQGTEKKLTGDVEVTEELAKRCFFEGAFFDPAEDIRQSLVLGLPMKPLCKVDCKGLCQKCRKNLNTGQCRCSKA